MEDLINTKQLCELLDISENTAYNWRRKEGMPYIQVNRKVIKYSKKDIEEWFDRNKKNKKS